MISSQNPNRGQRFRAALLQAAAFGGLMLAALPGTAAANDECTLEGSTRTCSGDQSNGGFWVELLAPDVFAPTLNIVDLTAPVISIRPDVFGLYSLRPPSEDQPALTVNADDSVVIMAQGSNAGIFVGNGITVLGYPSAAPLNIFSGATITLESGLSAITRAQATGNIGARNLAQSNYDRALAAVEAIQAGQTSISGAVRDYECLRFGGDTRICFLLMSFSGYDSPSDARDYLPEIYDYLFVQSSTVRYWDAPQPPEEYGNAGPSALRAISIGGGVNEMAAGGAITIRNGGALTTSGAYTYGILAESLGANGNVPNAGGTVHVTNDGAINTSGVGAVGILARSAAGWLNVDYLVAGDGAAVLVDGSGAITTQGASAYGIYAASNGGNTWDTSGHQGGGDSSTATVRYGGLIQTQGDYATGVWAISRAGNGGNGSSGGPGDPANWGSRGGWADAATIEILEGGGVITQGDDAHAVAAFSIGGTGGRGGGGGAEGRSGGRGGEGGFGGEATATNHGLLQTHGDNSYGMFVQSLAGNGGRGGSADAVFIGNGADGGPAGGGGAASAYNHGVIETEGYRAFGILAQSIGGRGGAGGDGEGVFRAHGGDGGSAASERCQVQDLCPDGGAVTVHNFGLIQTSGESAHNIFAQSIGGGGGAGGDGTGWISVRGGGGGDAGDGGAVEVINSGVLSATGEDASAIFAQSIGGGGGAGGDATSVGLYVAVAVGAQGGAGGNGSTVVVENTGSISTGGARTDAILAQSIGGGGGVGGSATSIAFGAGGAASVAIGGNGEAGGDGSDVTVTNAGEIDVRGDFSNAIFAQSIGGGGGQGGNAYAFSLAAGDKFSLAASVAVGGSGNRGGAGHDVTVTNTETASIVTHDFNSFGILAQSIGGGGGAGGASMAQSVTAQGGDGMSINVSVAVGGRGGDGGDVAGIVDVTNDGSIKTYGDGSTAIVAQSIGGGGGTGGDASTSATAFSMGSSSNLSVTVSVGGKGGAGNVAGDVIVTNNGDIVTLGTMANGITAQSIGGGGGTGGTGDQTDLFEDADLPTEPPDLGEEDDSRGSRTRARDRFGQYQQEAADVGASSNSAGRARKKSTADGAPGSAGLGLSIGGDGGSGGHGMRVDVINTGEILTGGFMSMGVFAQSIGGGGGLGGAGRGESQGDVGLGVGLGGFGAAAGDGGVVDVQNFGAITTLQAMSHGVFAQSVGGGGGTGGVGAGERSTDTSLSMGIGGRGGASGIGGQVDVLQDGDVLTFGLGAIGVFAQSVGGGGGFGGGAEQDTFASIALGGTGTSGGNGGEVGVEVYGDIVTEGDFAHGVMAQSVGGGGGVGGGVETRSFAFGIDPFGQIEIDTGLVVGIGTLGVGGDAGGGGDGLGVTIESHGQVTTIGRNAHGIFAQSIGGGGGSGGGGGADGLAIALSGSNGAQGAAAAITVTHSGDVRAWGENSAGIYAQSMGGAEHNYAGGNIVITLTGGDVQGGSGEAGVGVFFSGGASNELHNLGGAIYALSGIAIAGTDGDEHIFNRGRVSGNVGLGGGANTFHNETTGLFETGSAIYIGSTLLNDGRLSPFGAGVVGQTTFAGDVTQSASGVLLVDVNFGGASDFISVDGTARLNGSVRPLIGHVSDLRENTFVTVLTAGSLIDQGIEIDAYDTLVIDYASRISGQSLQVGVAEIEFGVSGLDAPEYAVASHLQGIWEAGGAPEYDAIMDHLGAMTSVTPYAATLAPLHPDSAFSAGGQPVLAASAFLNGALSCPEARAALREQSCVWARGGEFNATQDANGSAPAHEQDASRYQAGAQFEARPNWFVGVSLGSENGAFTIANQAQAELETLHLGATVKRQAGDWLFSGAVDYAYVQTERTRLTGFPTIVAASSESDDNILAARFRAAYLMQAGAFYARPMLDLDLYSIWTGGFTESGAGAFNLTVADEQQTVLQSALGVELGLVRDFGGVTLHPFVQLGASHLSDDALDLPARFEGAPAGAPDFTVSTALQDSLLRAQVGLDVQFARGAFRVEYEQRQGDGYEDEAVSAKFTLNF